VDHLVSVCLSLHPQLKYRKDQKKMKGTSHFTSLTSEDNLALKNARKISKLVSEVRSLGFKENRTWIRGWPLGVI
jgi:hypothetical protein